MVPLVSKISGTKKVESVQETCTDTAWNCQRTNLSKGSTDVKDKRNKKKKVESMQETCTNTAWNCQNWAKHALFSEWTCIIQNIDNFIVYVNRGVVTCAKHASSDSFVQPGGLQLHTCQKILNIADCNQSLMVHHHKWQGLLKRLDSCVQVWRSNGSKFHWMFICPVFSVPQISLQPN